MTLTTYRPAPQVGGLDATVVVGTYGGDGWADMAADRAIPSALSVGFPVVHCHLPDGTLAEARNQAVAAVGTPWVIHLDADDRLGGGFAAITGQAAAAQPDVDVLAVQVCYVHGDGYPGVAHWPHVYNHTATGHDCTAECLADGNWLVVGCPVRTEIAQRVRWEEWERYEDYAFWARCWQAGARFGRAADAVYFAHVRPESRNQRGRPGVDVHRAIALELGLPVP